MNKLISKIVGVALGLTLATGVGAGVVLGNNAFAKADAVSSPIMTFDFEDSTAHRTSGSNSYSSTANTYSENGVDIVATYADSVTSGTPLAGSANITARVGKNTKNSPSIVLGPMDLSSYNVTGFTYYAKTVGTLTLTASYSTNGTTWTQAETHAGGTSSTQYSSSTLSVNEPSTFYVKIVVSITNGNSTTSNRDTQIDDIVISGESTSTSSLTGISCSAQTVSVLNTVNLANEITFTPSDAADKTVSYSIKSGSNYIDLDTTTGVVTGKKGGSAVVTITPNDTTGGATAIDVSFTVNSIAAPDVTIGNQYSIYCIDSSNNYNAELSGVSSNLGTLESFNGSVPPCNTLWTAEAGYYENTVAFTNGSIYLSLTAAANSLNSESSVTKNSSWVVSWDDDTEAAVVSNAVYQNRQINFNYNNGSNMRFACYTGTQAAISLHEYSVQALTDFTIDASITVYKTGTATIGVTYTPADASDKTLTWASDDTSVATVADGVVTGVAVGTCNVTASKLIGNVTVTRTCEVTVLNNKAAHLGTSADPFDVNDAVNVAKGIFTQTSNGTAIDLSGTYYNVQGIITKADTRTTTNLTFWIGDNANQISAATGGLQIFKAAKVYGESLSDYYSENSEVSRDFVVGCTVKASGKLVYYNNVTPEMNQGGFVDYNSYIEARTFAEAFNTALEAVCDADGNTVAADLASAWSTQATAFTSLKAVEQAHLTNATAKTTSSATAVELCAAKYDYILGKYGTSTLSNFMNRTVAASSANVGLRTIVVDSNSALMIVVITAFVSVTFVGGYFFLRKKKEN